jgi:uncharacterized membrane protein YkoI
MIRKNALLMASAVTALILVLVGGVAARLPSDASAQGNQGEGSATSIDEQALATLVQQRETAYRQMIDQANQLLAQPPAASDSPSFPISADTAVAIVLTTVRGGSLEKPPELVDYMGAAAWEVALVEGLVYVDANTGKILANGALPVVVVIEQDDGGNGGGSSGEHEDDDHHEEEDHEDEEDAGGGD